MMPKNRQVSPVPAQRPLIKPGVFVILYITNILLDITPNQDNVTSIEGWPFSGNCPVVKGNVLRQGFFYID